MAQEVQAQFPEAITEIENKDGSTNLGVKYQYFSVYAVQAIKEQQQIITTLEEKLAQQEAKLAKLEAAVKQLLEKK